MVTTLLVVMMFVGCRKQGITGLELEAHSPAGADPRRLEVRAQVAGVQGGVRYKWIADTGECEPQESEWPFTMFKFAEGTPRDRVTVELWRGEKRIAQKQIEV